MTEVEEPEETQLTGSFLLYVGNNFEKGIPDCEVSSAVIELSRWKDIFLAKIP